MATQKFSDLLKLLQFHASTDTMCSVGIAPALTKVVLDLLTDKDPSKLADPVEDVRSLLAVCAIIASADAAKQVTMTPGIAAEIMNLDQQHVELSRQVSSLTAELATAHAAYLDLQDQLTKTRKQHEAQDIRANDHEVKATNLTAMRDYIKERLPALNAARTAGTNSEQAIDDICRAIDVGCDPTVNKVPDDQPGSADLQMGPTDNTPPPSPPKKKLAKDKSW